MFSLRGSCVLPLVAAFLLLGVLVNCSVQVPGTSVEIAFESETLPDHIEDVSVDFSRGFVVVEEIELLRCDASLAERVWRAVLPSVAYAHGESSPTQLGVPVAIDLTRAFRVEAGLLTPPAGRYCSVRVRAAPSDGDGVGVPVEAGRSLWVEGTATRSGAGEMSLDWRSSSTVDRVVLLEEPLELDPQQKDHRLVVTLTLDDWLRGEDLTESGPAKSAVEGSYLLRRLVERARIRHRSLSP